MISFVCDLKTGDLIDEYPLEINQSLERRLGDYRSGTLALNVLDTRVPAGWRETVLPWRTIIVVCDDDEQIVWAGVPTSIETDGAPTVLYQCVTLEKYFDRRYMPDADYRQADQTSRIARDMAEWCGDDVIGIGLEYDTPASGVKRDRTYYGDEDARILTRLQQLAAVRNGFEWTISVEWRDDDHTGVRKVFRTGYPTLGRVTDTPEYVFEVSHGVPGPVSGFTHATQWGEGEAATHVQAVGDGEGEDKPYSSPVVDGDREASGWPRLEERKTQQGVIEQDTLDTYAQGMADRMFGGQRVLEFEAVITEWPTPADINLGDTARVIIETDQITLDEVWRIVGYSIDHNAGTWKPVIARIGEQEDDSNA